MRYRLRATLLFIPAVLVASVVEAQEWSSAERTYHIAVADYFELPEAEIAILAHWDLPPDEIPVVLFMARRAGVSAEALVALRESAWSWTELAQRYRIGPHALHVPLRDPASAGALAEVYERFSRTPVIEWPDIHLSASDIVALVNVRVLSQSMGVPPDDVMRHTRTDESFVDLYARLLR